MSEVPAVSVVIPLYNKGPYIARALNSVLAQTFQDFEVIVVDDGSTDDGAEVVRGFDDPRIWLIQQENRGVSAARNRGIEAARAELVAFLDADDEWLPGFLETILRLRTLYPDAGLYGTAYELHYPGSIVETVCTRNGGDRLLPSYFGAIVNYGPNNPHHPFNSSSFAAPKNILLGIGGFPRGVKWNEDVMLWGVVALQFPVAYSPDVCSIIHRHTANDSSEVTEYQESPFPQYVSTISKDELLGRDDAEDLTKYCDYLRLAAISRNIYSGHGARARLELSSVKSPHWTWKKYKLQMLSYIPQCGMQFIRNHAKSLSYLKRKIKTKIVHD
jgi:glycosyltransferase involved in cell wall biosynthesis